MIVKKYPTNAEIEMLRKKRKNKNYKWDKGSTVAHQSGDLNPGTNPGGGAG